jgi:hypothetical protein
MQVAAAIAAQFPPGESPHDRQQLLHQSLGRGWNHGPAQVLIPRCIERIDQQFTPAYVTEGH